VWSELTYLVERRCREAPPARDLAARALVVLYGAVSNCEIAFERLESGDSDGDHSDAVLAMDAMFAVLHNLQPVLHLFDPEPARDLEQHVGRPLAHRGQKEPLKRHVEMLRRLLSRESAESHFEVTPTAFRGARRELARFILDKYSPEELFSAQPLED